jgi:Pyruvate/2-oxoacid:ferredoxin oxidoreductase gamma subunit
MIKNMNFKVILFTGIFVAMIFSFTTSFAFAHPHSGQIMIDDHTHEPQTETIPLDGVMALEKSTIFFHISEENSLPWGFVEGNIANHVEGYPVVIQIFKNDEAVHFAQTNVEQNGDYEYKFRVLYSDNGFINKIYEGNYSVKIFKVVYMNPENII